MSNPAEVCAAWLKCSECERKGVEEDAANQIRLGVTGRGEVIVWCPRCSTSILEGPIGVLGPLLQRAHEIARRMYGSGPSH